MGLVAIHPQESFCFCCFRYILNIYIMLLLIVQVIFEFVKISFQKLCFEFKIDGWDC